MRFRNVSGDVIPQGLRAVDALGTAGDFIWAGLSQERRPRHARRMYNVLTSTLGRKLSIRDGFTVLDSDQRRLHNHGHVSTEDGGHPTAHGGTSPAPRTICRSLSFASNAYVTYRRLLGDRTNRGAG
jgi:hypothetical protein